MESNAVFVCLWKFLESSSKLAVSAFAYPIRPHSICTKISFLHKNLQGVCTLLWETHENIPKARTSPTALFTFGVLVPHRGGSWECPDSSRVRDG